MKTQPVRQFTRSIEQLAGEEHYLFSLTDLRALLPDHSSTAFKALISRAEKNGLLKRVCRGVYLYPKVTIPTGLILFHSAALLRAGEFNYISLETALSDSGIISQIPHNWITIMSSGRSNRIRCGAYGAIEFIHTAKRASDLVGQLVYDSRCHLWRASVSLAVQDMRLTRRSTDLVDWSSVHESV